MDSLTPELRDRPIEITEEMIEAGLAVLEQALPDAAQPACYARSVVERVFATMNAAVPSAAPFAKDSACG